jgi:hypothetical protein
MLEICLGIRTTCEDGGDIFVSWGVLVLGLWIRLVSRGISRYGICRFINGLSTRVYQQFSMLRGRQFLIPIGQLYILLEPLSRLALPQLFTSDMLRDVSNQQN